MKATINQVIKNQIALDAKRANQRLRELEKQGLTELSPAYQEVKGQFYLQDLLEGTDIYSRTANGQIKFRTDIATVAKEDPEKLLLLQTRLESFLKAGTSTTAGVKVRQDRIQQIMSTVSKKYGYSLSEKQAGALMIDVTLKNRLSEYMSSKDIAIVMNDIEQGHLRRDDVLDYLDEVDAGQIGWSLGEMYVYASPTLESEWEKFMED